MSLGKKTAVVSGLTLVSRILGVIRDAVIAMVLGATPQADAFFIAFRPFELLRKMMGDGIFSITFVPRFSRYLADGRRDQAVSMVLSALATMSVIGGILILAGWVSLPGLMTLMAPGFSPGTDAWVLTRHLFILMLPYLWLIMVISLCMGVLNSLGQFAVPAATPVLFNLVVVLFALKMAGSVFSPSTGIALGVVAGGVVQLAFQMPSMTRHGMLGRGGRLTGLHPGVVDSLKTMVPCMIGASAFQINMLGVSFYASCLGNGSVSFLYYAERLVQLPLSLIAVSMATVLLPSFSRQAAAGEQMKMERVFEAGIRVALFVTIPAMAGLMVLKAPIVQLLFQRGAFGDAAAAQTSGCLFFLATGVWAFTGSRLLATLHFAVGSFRQPFIAGLVAIGVNGVCAVCLGPRMGIQGLALSVSLGAAAGFIYLIGVAPARISFSRGRILVSGCRALWVSAIMTAIVKGAWTMASSVFDSGQKLWLGMGVVAAVGLGAVVVYLVARGMRCPEIGLVEQILKKESPLWH